MKRPGATHETPGRLAINLCVHEALIEMPPARDAAKEALKYEFLKHSGDPKAIIYECHYGAA